MEISLEKIEEEKVKERKRSYNHRHLTDETRNDTSQQESKQHSVTMDTPFSTSIPIVESQLNDRIDEKVISTVKGSCLEGRSKQ